MSCSFSFLLPLVSFGGAFIANPDMIERFRADTPLNSLDSTNVWGGRAIYTDYPAL
jgi:N-ethylmaleimide reductase